jgi:hypothetical protein
MPSRKSRFVEIEQGEWLETWRASGELEEKVLSSGVFKCETLADETHIPVWVHGLHSNKGTFLKTKTKMVSCADPKKLLHEIVVIISRYLNNPLKPYLAEGEELEREVSEVKEKFQSDLLSLFKSYLPEADAINFSRRCFETLPQTMLRRSIVKTLHASGVMDDKKSFKGERKYLDLIVPLGWTLRKHLPSLRSQTKILWYIVHILVNCSIEGGDANKAHAKIARLISRQQEKSPWKKSYSQRYPYSTKNPIPYPR